MKKREQTLMELWESKKEDIMGIQEEKRVRKQRKPRLKE